MSSNQDATQPPMRRVRRSLGVVARPLDTASPDLTVPSMVASRKKSRSKSIGPGGLDALKQSNGNRRQSIAGPPRAAPRSILKPAPLPEIPALKKRSDLTGPRPTSRRQSQSPDAPASANSSASGSKIAVRTEEEQQAAAREREERERRDARRKSLANRRVSFAAEATLHTFHEIDFFQDSTTSTEATRRQSQRTNATDDIQDNATAPQLEAAPAEAPPTSRRRRSSVASAVEDETAMSLYSDDSAADEVEDIVEEDASSSSSDDGTMMTVDDAEVTGVSAMTAQTVGSDDEDGGNNDGDGDDDDDDTLAAALRAATESAGDNASRRPLDSDDLDDGEEIIPAFVPWHKRSKDSAKPPAKVQPRPGPEKEPEGQEEDNDGGLEMEMTQGVGGILPQDQDGDETVGVGMDMTTAVGRILEDPLSSPRYPHSPGAQLDMDMSMEVTRAIGGIIQQSMYDDDQDGGELDEQTMEMELTRVVGGIRRVDDDAQDGDLPMELTTAMGGLLARDKDSSPREATTAVDVDMEMTMAVGGIIRDQPDSDEDELSTGAPASAKTRPAPTQPLDDGDKESMEMTATLDALLDAPPAESRAISRRIMEAEANAPGSPMAAALAVSRSSSPLFRRSVSARTTPQPSPPVQSAEMVSTPKGPASAAAARATPKGATGTPKGATSKTATPQGTTPRTALSRGASASKKTAEEAGAPKAATHQATTLKVAAASQSETPTGAKSSTRRTRSKTPEVARLAGPPVEQESPQSSPLRVPSSARPDRAPSTPSPGKTSRLVRRSPRRSPSPSRGQPVTTPVASRLSIFQNDPRTGARTPNVVLSPHKRTLSGVGADRAGLGSPKVAAKLDRRGSIGESTPEFVPTLDFRARGVTFEDPRAAAREEDREREAEQGDATFTLREMIDNLSPKKNLRGRKSLHVGSASGLLGKRPLELDDDDDDDEDHGGVKRLKGLPSSPVKNIHLPQPEITINGRMARAHSVDPSAVPATPSPAKTPEPTTTPSHLGHFKDAGESVTPMRSLATTPHVASKTPQGPQDPNGRIRLQDFLNMTSIRFMELNTTKRRPTIAPSALAKGTSKEDMSFEKCAVAGACTVPMLELYQHSCRELKKYISEGRRIVREIEAETYEDNPPIFREYMSAPPEARAIMDNQFKNVKTHARLLSKAMWYEWRTKLQYGLKEGLDRIAGDLAADSERIKKIDAILAKELPPLEAEHAALRAEYEELQQREKELADCDPEELEAARAELAELDAIVAGKQAETARLQARIAAADARLEEGRRQKQEWLEEIAEHERVREECRGWTTTEVGALRARVEALEKETGYSVIRIAETTLTMRYKTLVEVSIDASSFPTCSGPVTITRIADPAEGESKRPSAVLAQQVLARQFFIACTQLHLGALQRRNPALQFGDVLKTVRAGCDFAVAVGAQISRIALAFPTTLAPIEPSADAAVAPVPSMAMRSSLLLAPLKSRVEVSLVFSGQDFSTVGEGGLAVGAPNIVVTPSSRVVYGDNFNATRMTEFLASHVGTALGGGKNVEGDWSASLAELKARLIARGSRG